MKDMPENKNKEFTLTLEINRSGSLIVTLVEKHSGKSEHVTIQMENS